MKHDVRFSSPFRAMMYSAHYNPRGFRIIMQETRRLAAAKTPINLAGLEFCFAFAGVQGYPVVCFHEALVKKNLAIP